MGILRLACLTVPWLLPGWVAAAADPAFEADPRVVLLQAVGRTPTLEALRARAEAARERVGGAGPFPNPEVEVMASQVRMPGNTNPMWELNVRQPLPRWGERTAAQDLASAKVGMAEAEFAAMAGSMLAELGQMLAEAEAADARRALILTQEERLHSVLEAITARVGTGRAGIGERLALESRLGEMSLMRVREERMAEDARAEVRALLALDEAAALPHFAAPEVVEMDVDSAAPLLVAEAREREARAMGRMARAETRPMTAIGLKLEREEDSMGDVDTIGIGFMTDIPWGGRRAALAEEKAARAEARASRSEAEALRRRWTSLLARVGRAERQAEDAARLAAAVRQRLEAEGAAFVSGTGTGTMGGESPAPVLMLLELLERRVTAETAAIDATLRARQAQAQLWTYLPAWQVTYLY